MSPDPLGNKILAPTMFSPNQNHAAPCKVHGVLDPVNFCDLFSIGYEFYFNIYLFLVYYKLLKVSIYSQWLLTRLSDD